MLDSGTEFNVSFESVSRMNDGLIESINNTVGENDVLWFLGDWSFGSRDNAYRNAKICRDRIRCKTIHMVWGNHDDDDVISTLFTSCHNKVLTAIKEDGEYWVGQSEIRKDKRTRSAQKFVLDHYAPAVWDGSHKGFIALYGHSHMTAEKWLDENMPGRRSIDVGIDNANRVLGEYRPFSEDDIRKIMSPRGGFSMDHHKKR